MHDQCEVPILQRRSMWPYVSFSLFFGWGGIGSFAITVVLI